MDDAKHFLLKCARWQDEREKLIKRVKGKLLMILDGVCKERGVGMAVRKM